MSRWDKELENIKRLHEQKVHQFGLRAYAAQVMAFEPEALNDTLYIESANGDFVVLEYFANTMKEAAEKMQALALPFTICGQFVVGEYTHPAISRHRPEGASGPYILQVYAFTQLEWVTRPRLRVEIQMPSVPYGVIPVRLDVIVDPERQSVPIHKTNGVDVWGAMPRGISERGTHSPFYPNTKLAGALASAGGKVVHNMGRTHNLSTNDSHSYLFSGPELLYGAGTHVDRLHSVLEMLKYLQ